MNSMLRSRNQHHHVIKKDEEEFVGLTNPGERVIVIGDSSRASQLKKAKTFRINVCITTIFIAAACLLLFAVIFKTRSSALSITPTNVVSYTPPTHVSNNGFLISFEKLMSSTMRKDSYPLIPLILKGGKIFCRRSHMAAIENSRMHWYVDMVNKGLELEQYHHNIASSDDVFQHGLPIILDGNDVNGCDKDTKTDKFHFPRLTWSIFSPQYGKGWCNAVGAVSYTLWENFHNQHSHMWDHSFSVMETEYPWQKKINKAVWRGTTTGVKPNGKRFTFFSELPRAKLVKKSAERPDIVDAGFTEFNQGWEQQKEDLIDQNRTISSSRMSFRSQMKYKAIIDIDGNSWSSRYGKLLCMNSVVIKIEPDFIEYFYDQLRPMEHYVPASLDNITEVVEYVMDPMNELELKGIVATANSWCKTMNTKEQLSKEAVTRIQAFETSIYESYNSSWVGEWDAMQARIFNHLGEDLEHCIMDSSGSSESLLNFFAVHFARLIPWRDNLSFLD